jgi:hypothetical protein
LESEIDIKVRRVTARTVWIYTKNGRTGMPRKALELKFSENRPRTERKIRCVSCFWYSFLLEAE